MDILFVLIAVCPAVIAARYELREGLQWKLLVTKFAGWFYGITFINFIILYLQGSGSFDFSVLTVQFLVNYMLDSAAIVLLASAAKKIWYRVIQENKTNKERGSSNV